MAVSLETSPNAIQGVGFPHLGVPGLEPAGEGGRLKALFDGGYGHPAAARRIAVHILFGYFWSSCFLNLIGFIANPEEDLFPCVQQHDIISCQVGLGEVSWNLLSDEPASLVGAAEQARGFGRLLQTLGSLVVFLPSQGRPESSWFLAL
uniref:Uncharacterized protein n=1 Tax=Anguilla anguilla TaxID=7936 RepID=A0A0E9WXL2_ANGAN